MNVKVTGQKREFGVPLILGDCTGFLHDGGGSTAVLMMPTWGFEELTIHRGWAELAVMLAGAGYCCLRFDWPGVGDSLGDTGDGMTVERWKNVAVMAANHLRNLQGIDRLVLLGHGVGGLLAPHLAAELSADAVVMMAPHSQGRAGLRETDLMGKMMSSFLGMPSASTETVIDIAGFRIARDFVAEIAALKIENVPVQSALPVLAMSREGTRAATDWPERLRTAGFDVTEADYSGYEAFVAHTDFSVPPYVAFERVRSWLTEHIPAGATTGHRTRAAAGALLVGDGFVEAPVVFGKEGRLFGIVCRPEGMPSRAIVLLVNTGDKHHIGLARSHVEFSRTLANRGISTFRIDTSGTGDSAAGNAPIFYNEAPILDTLEAIAAAEHLNLGPLVLSGLCSGSYASLQAAVRDARVKGLVLTNAPRLAIGPNETVEEVLLQGTNSIKVYRQRALSLDLVREVLAGRMTVGGIAAKGWRVLKTQLRARVQRLFGTGLYRVVREQTDILRSRGVRTILIYSENEGGLDELARYFGQRRPEDYDHAEVRIVSDAEHTMVAAHARKAILDAISDVADEVSGRKAAL